MKNSVPVIFREFILALFGGVDFVVCAVVWGRLFLWIHSF